MNILIDLWELDLSKKEKDFVDYNNMHYSTYDIPNLIEKLSEEECVNNVYVNVNTVQIGSSVIAGPLFSLAEKENVNVYFNGIDRDSIIDEKTDKRIKNNTHIFKISENEPCLSLYFVREEFVDYCFGTIPASSNRLNVVGTFSGPTGSRLNLHFEKMKRDDNLGRLLKAPAVFLAKKQKDEGMDACYYRSGETIAYLLSNYLNNIEMICEKMTDQRTPGSKR